MSTSILLHCTSTFMAMQSLHPELGSKDHSLTKNYLQQNSTHIDPSEMIYLATHSVNNKNIHGGTNDKKPEKGDKSQINGELIKIKLDESLSGLENIGILAEHYKIPSILIKSLLGLNDKKAKKYLNSNVNNNLGSSGMGKDNVSKFILDLETELIDFIVTPSMDSWKLNPLNSYYRLLSHQLADYYHLGHILSNDGSSMVIFKVNTSLVNADDETKKNAIFDQSGNIKPLSFKDLEFDANEKLNRIKLLDLYNAYMEFFTNKYIQVQNERQNNEHMFTNFQKLQLNNQSAFPLYTLQGSNVQRPTNKNIHLLQRNVNENNYNDTKLLNIDQKPGSTILTDETFPLPKGAKYELAKEKIKNDNPEIEVTWNEGGNLKDNNEEGTNPQVVVGFPNTNNIEAFKPDNFFAYNYDYDYNYRYYNNSYGYRRSGNRYYNKRAYNRNGYKYQQYSHYPTNQTYSTSEPSSQSHQQFEYISSQNKIPLTASAEGNKQSYYYVPAASPGAQSLPAPTTTSSPPLSLKSPSSTVKAESTINNEKQQGIQHETNWLDANSGNAGNNSTNNVEYIAEKASSTSHPPINVPLNNIPEPPMPMDNESMQYKYYHQDNKNQYHPRSSGRPLMYYGSNISEHGNNQYLYNNGGNNGGRNRRYWSYNKGGNMNNMNSNYNYNYNYNHNTSYTTQNRRYSNRSYYRSSVADSITDPNFHNQQNQKEEEIG